MASQTVKFLDIAQSYIPSDPDSFPVNLMDYTRADQEELPKKIVAYAGHNFMPTATGYRSYFGTQHQLDIEALTAKIDYVLVLQTSTYTNVLIALCEDGCYIKFGEESGSWNKVISQAVPEEYLPWHWTVLSNDLYAYRTGDSVIHKFCFNPADILGGLPSLTPADVGLGLFTPTANGTIPAYDYMVAFPLLGGLFTSFSTWYTAPAGQSGIIGWNTPAAYAGATTCRVYRKKTDGTIHRADMYSSWPTTPNWQFPSPDTDYGWTLHTAGFPDYTAYVPSVAYFPIKVPIQFLNTAAQQGMFSAGLRLGFWDSENSISWSSIDNVGDFTPSLTTLAGAAIFADVVGKIVTISRMRDGFIIYATQSIVYVAKDLSSSMGWRPQKLADFGVAYAKQVTTSPVIDRHFAYTSAGIYKVEASGLEALVPDFYELTKRTEIPWYMDLLCHRYLMITNLDPKLDYRTVRTRVDTLPGIRWKIADGITKTTNFQDLGDILNQPAGSVCATIKGVPAVHAYASGEDTGDDPYAPLWDAFYVTRYATGHVPASIEWTIGGPCDTKDINNVALPFYPANALIGSTPPHIEFADDPNGPSGYWQTIEKFIATQTAIWAEMDKKRLDLLNEILSKTHISETYTRNSDYTVPGMGRFDLAALHGLLYGDPKNAAFVQGTSTESVCDVGYLPIAFSDPYLQINECGVFYTRLCIARLKLMRHTRNTTSGTVITYTGPDGWHAGHVEWAPVTDWGSGHSAVFARNTYPTAAALDAAWMAIPGTPSLGKGKPRMAKLAGPHSIEMLKDNTGGIPSRWILLYIAYYFKGGKVQNKAIRSHSMIAGQVEYGVWGIDQGSMVVAGWKQRFLPGIVMRTGEACEAPTLPDPPYKSPTYTMGFPGSDDTGSICGQPYIPIELPPPYSITVRWPDQYADLPAIAWLMQKGQPAPAYPVLQGAYVYDLALKKWGRHKDAFQVYIDYYPVNTSPNQAIPYEAFQVKAGIVNMAGKLCIFDDEPTSSEICYGKIGYYRQGTTNLEEVRVHFAGPSTGYIVAEPSYDAQFPEASNTAIEAFEDANQATLFANLSAKWYNVVISGKYDISYLEFRGVRAGRR